MIMTTVIAQFSSASTSNRDSSKSDAQKININYRSFISHVDEKLHSNTIKNIFTKKCTRHSALKLVFIFTYSNLRCNYACRHHHYYRLLTIVLFLTKIQKLLLRYHFIIQPSFSNILIVNGKGDQRASSSQSASPTYLHLKVVFPYHIKVPHVSQ